jgi:hypothetical protein
MPEQIRILDGDLGHSGEQATHRDDFKTRVSTRHISISCCQSRLLRANRGTSRAATATTLPRHTSATIRSKPALGPACCGTAKVVIDHLDLGATERRQAITHRILQRAALAVVQHLISGRLPYV